MARLPKTQAETVNLVEAMLKGFTEHADVFKNAEPDKLRRLLEEFNSASDTLAKAQKEAAEAAKQKLESFNEMKKISKRLIRQAELDCADDPAKLVSGIDARTGGHGNHRQG